VLAYDPIVWEDEGIGIHVADVIHDAVIGIRLRGVAYLVTPNASRQTPQRSSRTADSA
jgi:hypothetical protein